LTLIWHRYYARQSKCPLVSFDASGRQEVLILRQVSYRTLLTTRRRGTLAVVAALVALLTMASPGNADAQTTRANPVESSQPQVLVLAQQRDPSGTANIAVSYTKAVPDAEARRDFAEIVRAAGWVIIEGPIPTTSPGSTPEIPAMTSVEFTAANALPSAPGGLPIEPLVIALKRFTSIELIFVMRQDFRFRGLGDFENEFVDIRLRRSPNTCSYSVRIKRADFTRLNLPTIVPAGRRATTRPARASAGRIIWPIALSVIIGGLVWVIARRARKADRS